MRSRSLIVFFALFIPVLSVYFFSKAAGRVMMAEKTEIAMGTVVQIKAPIPRGVDRKSVERAIDEALKEIRRIESVFSVFRPDSEISKINRLGPGEKLKISDEVFDLIEKARLYNEKTEGAFDITVKPLVDLWHIRGGGSSALPSGEEIEDAACRVGMRYVILDRASRTISFERSGMGLDFGGVAKGYATDSAAAVLKRMGVRNAVVSCGGDIYCIGKRSGSGMWNVGIQHPRNRRKMLFRMEIEDMAVDTSGDYEKYYFVKGRRYSHIIDPRTGYPIGDGIISATVVARDAVTADMLATALCVLGRRGLGVVNRIEGAGALIVHNENGVFRPEATEGFIGRFNVRSR